MATNCQNCPLRGRQLFVDLTSDELDFMKEFKIGELSVDAGTTVLLEGSSSPQLYTALYGMGLRYKMLDDGRRQVVNFVFPGDFIGLQAGVMGEMQHTVEATTNMTLCVFSRSEIWSLFKHQPERAYDLTWLAAQEEHFLGETLATVGQRNGAERIAWGLLKIYLKGEQLGLAKDGVMKLSYKQAEIADALGLSLVHTNRTLKSLREKQIAAWQNDILTIWDLEGLAKIAGTGLDRPKPRPLF